MILNYITLAFRLLKRNLFNTMVNILGLSAGFAAFFILWQYSQSELHADQFHHDFERIYRFGMIYRYAESNGITKLGNLAVNDPELTRIIAEGTGEIEDFTRVFAQKNFSKDYVPIHGQEIYMSFTDEEGKRNSFFENDIAYADPNLFTFFNFPLKEGNPSSVLKEAYSVLLSERTAEKYFGKEEPVGKILQMNNEIPLKVTGVFRNLPVNTHLSFEMVISSVTIANSISKISMTNGGPFCYIKARDGVNIKNLEDKIKQIADARFNQLFKNSCGTCNSEAYLQPLSEVPFNTGYWFETAKPKSKYLLMVLSTISILILFMAWINYVNLTITSNLKRVKELAVRKTMGARYFDFIKQFVMESFIVNFISAITAVAIVILIRNPVENLLQFYLPDFKNVSFTTVLISAIAFIFGILFTGFYPAFITLKNNANDLYGSTRGIKNENIFSRFLTTIQYSFAVVLIIWIFSIHLQIDYIMNKDLGIRKDQVITVDLPVIRPPVPESELSSFSFEVLKVPGISGCAISNSLPGFQSKFFVIEMNGRYFSPQTNGGVDEDFIPLYRIKILAGRNFQPDNPSDRSAIIVSRTTTVQMGFTAPSDAISQRIRINTVEWSPEMASAEIIGVIEDYKVDPLFSSIKNRDGIALTYKNFLVRNSIPPRKISLTFDPDHFSESIRKTGELYHSTFPEAVFNWNFLDQQIGRQYFQDKTTRNQIAFFALLAIAIACLGLLGLIRNKAAEKIKEMGVRKVLGAGFHHLGYVLLNTTIRQMLLAIVMGIPASIYLSLQYREKFAERVSMRWWHFAVPLVILSVIMLSTIAATLYKVNRTNPVDALKYE